MTVMGFDDPAYDALIKDLFSKHPSVQSAGFKSGAYKPGLEGMMRFDEALGSPWKRFRSVHVAGTNGKGSVCSMLAAALAATGLKVGLYTSPHLIDFRERIKIIGNLDSAAFPPCETSASLHPSHAIRRGPLPFMWPRAATVSKEETLTEHMSMIPREAVWEFLTQKDTDGLSFFEITTGMAFWWFDLQKVDVAVIEVGLGGRLDSTNIITPQLSVVTSIGLDHCAMLGDTRAKIASEKAGIFKPGVPALVATTDDETAPVFKDTAASIGCPLYFADSYETSVVSETNLDLRGPCQEVNLRTVLRALEILGVEPDMDAIARAGAMTGFHGRWEKLQDNPEVICDIGHNSAALEPNFKRLTKSGRPLIIVYGIMADKDLDAIAPLMPSEARYILAAPSTERALKVEALAGKLRVLRPDLRTETAPGVAEAVAKAIEMATKTPGSLVYIGGSTFVVSEAVTSLHADI